MKLQTKLPLIPERQNQIDYASRILLLGSCFVENIGEKLEYFKFQNNYNPFGNLFHPLAIENLIANAVNEKQYSESDIFQNNEQWHCFDAHSELNASSKNQLLTNLNAQIESTSQELKKATHIVFTLGTAWVYRLIEDDLIVANCHKVPQKKFAKELLSVDEIEEILLSIIALIRNVNNSVSIIFTVSPIRHIKDGFVENTRSKAHLVAAIHQVIEPRIRHFYFPSFEIMMDELRDYRFYNEDMIHPNKTDVNYIWEKFIAVWVSEEARKTMEDVDVIQRGLLHRPFAPNSAAHLKFLKNLEIKQKALSSKFPHLIF